MTLQFKIQILIKLLNNRIIKYSNLLKIDRIKKQKSLNQKNGLGKLFIKINYIFILSNKLCNKQNTSNNEFQQKLDEYMLINRKLS